jgi:DNA invertase Pin-like site-specific DNA recombinase
MVKTATAKRPPGCAGADRAMEVARTFAVCGFDLYLDQQAIDTTTPAGKLMFQITGAFAEFERSMIRTRINSGLKRAKDEIKRKGHFVTKHGEVKKRLGRPNADPDKLRKARAALAKGIWIVKVAKLRWWRPETPLN